jgi:hypothetical protein
MGPCFRGELFGHSDKFRTFQCERVKCVENNEHKVFILKKKNTTGYTA